MAGKETKASDANVTALILKTNAEVNVRAEARIGAEIIKILPEGADVTVVGKSGKWIQIENSERQAFIMAEYIDIQPENPDETISDGADPSEAKVEADE